MAAPVLLVHDDIASIASVRRLLAREGFEVVLASSAADAIIAFGHYLPGLIILAPTVEGGRGRVVLEELAQHPDRHLARVVLLGEAIAGFSAPVVPLPLDGRLFMDTVHQVMRDTGDAPAWTLVDDRRETLEVPAFNPEAPEMWPATPPPALHESDWELEAMSPEERDRQQELRVRAQQAEAAAAAAFEDAHREVEAEALATLESTLRTEVPASEPLTDPAVEIPAVSVSEWTAPPSRTELEAQLDDFEREVLEAARERRREREARRAAEAQALAQKDVAREPGVAEPEADLPAARPAPELREQDWFGNGAEAARLEAERAAAEELARLEAEWRTRAEEEARREAERAAAEELALLEAQARADAEAESRREAERAAAEELARLEAETRAAAELEARRQLEALELERAQAVSRRDAEERARREIEELERAETLRREAEARALLERELRARLEEQERLRAEAEARAAQAAAERERLEAEFRARLEERARLLQEAEERARREAEARAEQEAAQRALEERLAAEAAARAKQEAAQRALEERLAAEAAVRAKQEAAQRALEERLAAEAAARAKQEAAQRALEERLAAEAAARAEQEAAQRALEERLAAEAAARAEQEAAHRELEAKLAAESRRREAIEAQLAEKERALAEAIAREQALIAREREAAKAAWKAQRIAEDVKAETARQADELRAQSEATIASLRAEVEKSAELARLEREERAALESRLAELRRQSDEAQARADEAHRIAEGERIQLELERRARIDAEAAALRAREEADQLATFARRPLERPGAEPIRLPPGGTVSVEELSRIVVRLAEARAQVRLDLRVEDAHRTLWFQRGALVGAVSSLPHESLLERARRDGLIDARQDSELRLLRGMSPGELLEQLRARGYLRDTEVVPLVQRYTEAIALEALSEPKSDYRLSEEPPAPGIPLAAIPRDPLHLAFEALRRALDGEARMASVGGLGATPERRAIEVDLRLLPLGDRERRFFAQIDGETTVEELLLASGLRQENALRLLAAAHALGWIELRPAEIESNLPTAELELARLDAKYREIQEADYFTILGLSRQAGGEEVQRAFKLLSAEFDPLKFAGHPDATVQQRARAVQEALQEAAQVLQDDRLRLNYARHLVD